ncbi:MAG TPA: RNA polymerase sigma factor [Thermoanaerobaculia bacterium]|nr:RNA polymerase sigma factor [Thermoanaerobaculia bacterium]
MLTPLPTPDLLLARRAAAGQPAAWDEIIGRYGQKLYNLAFHFTGSLPEAEDLTQEIFLRLYQNLRLYRGDSPLAAWTMRLSRNLCIDRYRKLRRDRRSVAVPDEVLEQVPATDDQGAEAEHRQQLRAIYRALEEMPEDLAEAVVLRDLQGWTLEEAATYLDVPLGTIKSRLHRARLLLAEKVAERPRLRMVEGAC